LASGLQTATCFLLGKQAADCNLLPAWQAEYSDLAIAILVRNSHMSKLDSVLDQKVRII
jgi:hypothetical protein